jgi:hypothetical protein
MPHVDELVHDQHDPILVVSLASGDLAATDRDYIAAQSLISSCSDCARLHEDILAIARATKALPPVERTRDFRLTDADAAKLRPAGWRRVLSGLANGPLFSRQLGAGLATLGIAGLLITALPAVPLGMSGAAAPSQPAAAASQPAAAAQGPVYESLESSGSEAAMAPAPSLPAPSVGLDTSGGGEPSVQAFHDGTSGSRSPTVPGVARYGADATARPPANNPTLKADVPFVSAPADQGSSGGPSTIAIVSAVLLVAGLLLLLARRLARGATSA